MSIYDYDRYISSGESWESTARSREASKDYLGAKSAYFDAAFDYDRAADAAKQIGDNSRASHAESKARSARSNGSYMSNKYYEACREYCKQYD